MLCVQADVEKKLQWDITAEPDPVVASLIADAQAMIEAEVGRPLESAARTETFDGRPWTLFLTYWPVTSITSVTEDGTLLTVTTDYLFYERGKLIRVTNGYQNYWRAYKPQSLEVDYVGGYLAGTHDKELEHLGSICAEVVARAFRKGAASAAIPPGTVGSIQSISLEGSDSVTYASDSGSASISADSLSQFVYLEEDERRQLHLDVYQRPRFGFA
jgi:hypothetical protein